MDTQREVLDLLCENARVETADIARQLGVAEEEVAAAVDALEADGSVRGYQAVVDWEAVGEERVRAFVECNVTLDRETGYDDIAGRLVKFDEVRTLRLVSGDYDFALTVEGESMSAVSRFVSEQVAPVPEVTQTVTHFIMESYKEAGIEFGDGHDDDRLSVTP
ncbi:Lrp/AsnC family transcriptional regulator [Halomarina ordinaria]|uniref:Lrp/AsnC family transcriptional regulator n=1 Tax=Halomarina ordinaria TaxID=3033939 RepID=A0ABD5U9A3_9EURY|nr:Lrp/AsnC family transcriptional regulator [Halomarina sp. PSRA2]